MNWFWYYDIVDRRLLAFLRESDEPVNTVYFRSTGLGLTYLALIPMLMSFPFTALLEFFGAEHPAGSIFMLSFTGLTWVYLLVCHYVRRWQRDAGKE